MWIGGFYPVDDTALPGGVGGSLSQSYFDVVEVEGVGGVAQGYCCDEAASN